MQHLIVCCDGTWNTAEQRHDGVPVPTNVVRLFNALGDAGSGGEPQLKYYHPGVGTEPGWLERTTGGATGAGLDRNIMSAYHWLCRNYQSGDRIFLFGFSRGAYTVRSLGGFVITCGLLDPRKLAPEDVWKGIERLFQRGYRERREKAADWEKDKLRFHAIKGDSEIPIYMIGVWDTVGALGVPNDLALLNLLDASDEHSFHDTTLSKRVEHARHAVALDEIRASFQPTLWTGDHPDLEQVWFPGVHCDVGGGYRETGLSDGALKWMIEEAQALGLGFREDMIDEEQIAPNPRGVLHESYTDVFRLLPNQPRSAPRLDMTGKKPPPDVHSSVIERRKRPPISHAPYRATVPLAKAGTHEITIYAMNPWNETGLYLEKGARYRFEARGEWLDRTVACGPDGTNDGNFQAAELAHLVGSALGELETLFKKKAKNLEANFAGTKRHDRIEGERVPWFCLVGAIANGGTANENGQPGVHETFKIGSRREYTPQESGYFYAYANDAWNFYENNRGSVLLTVTRL